MAKQGSEGGKRRFFSAEFKLEAVARMRERRAAGISLNQIGREVGVRPDMLRAWAKQAGRRNGAAPRDAFPGQGRLPADQEELRRLQRENTRLQQENEFLKKSGGVLRERVAVREKYAVIAAHRDAFPVTLMCAALGVSTSGFHAAQARARGPAGARAGADERLRVEVRAAHRKSRGTYGAPRVHQELRAQGTRVAKKRVARLMREDGLAARPRRRGVRTTDAAHAHPVAPNALARRFGVVEIGGPDRGWAGDITYIPTDEGWLYLAAVLDLGSRRAVGWAMRDSIEEALVLDARAMALRQRRPAAGLLVHSDRGSQYAGGAHRALLAAHGLTCSMSRTGDGWDNAVGESFFATLEHELLATTTFPTRAAARRALFEFIEVWYNRERRHSTLGYVSPAEYEARLQAA